MSLKRETKASLERYFDLKVGNGLYYEALRTLAVESNSYALGNENSIVKNIEIDGKEVKFTGGRTEDFSNKRTPNLDLSYNAFLEILDLYSGEEDKNKRLFAFVDTIYKEIISAKENLEEDLFILTARKIFYTFKKELSDFSENLIKKEIEVKRKITKKKDAIILYENSFKLFKAIYSLFIKYSKFIKSPKYKDDLEIEEKKTAFKIFQENSMTSKDKLMNVAKREQEKQAKNVVVEKKEEEEQSDIQVIDFYSEGSAESNFDVDEAEEKLRNFKNQDEDKIYFIYDEEQFNRKARKGLIKNEAYIIDGTRYLQKNDNHHQFLKLLLALKRQKINMYINVDDNDHLNTLNKFLREYRVLASKGKLESIYNEPENTAYLSSLGLFVLPKNLSIFEKINKELNIENEINPLYFNLSYLDNPVTDEIALETLRNLEKGYDYKIKEREDYLRKNKQKIIDDEIAVFYSTYSYDVIENSFIEKERLRNSKAFPIQEKEFLSVIGPRNINLLFRDNKLIIDGNYINDSDRKEFYSIAFVSLDEEDGNERAESAWAKIMEDNSLYRAIFNISSKNLANIFKSINGYAEGYVFNKTKLEYSKKATEEAKKYGIEPFEFIQPTIIVASENRSEKLEISKSDQLLVQTNPDEIKKKIYFLFNDWTEENSPIYVEEDYIGNDEEYDIIHHVRKENNKNLHQFLEQVTIFEHIDAFIEKVKIDEIDYHFYRNINKVVRNFLVEKVLDITEGLDKKLIEYIYNDSIFLGEFQEKLNIEALNKYKISEFPFYKYDAVKDLFYAYIDGLWENKLNEYKLLYKNETLKKMNYEKRLEDFGPTEEQKELIKKNIEFIENRLRLIRDVYIKIKSIKNIHVKKEYVLTELIIKEANKMIKNSKFKETDIETFIEDDRRDRFILLGDKSDE